METYKTILFTSNLSENSRYAFIHAARLARGFGSKIILLYVIDEMPQQLHYRISALYGEVRWKEMLESHVKEAKRTLTGKVSSKQWIQVALNAFCDDEGISAAEHGVAEPEVIISEGDVVKTILEQSELSNCDLIIMGASKGLLSGTSVGNTIKSVLKGAKVPVMVVPPAPSH
ncbi:MAG: universal stress protein [Desulfobacteraceae bacterium]|nr:MAG: universal stress protein [Desulfobacteraceae bacterium]